jgi:hypothetical protein
LYEERWWSRRGKRLTLADGGENGYFAPAVALPHLLAHACRVGYRLLFTSGQYP